jgi:hypothetical protein
MWEEFREDAVLLGHILRCLSVLGCAVEHGARTRRLCVGHDCVIDKG